MNLLIILIILGFLIGNIFKLYIPNSEVNFTILDLSVSSIWLVYLVKRKLLIIKDINLKTSLVYSIFIFVLVCLISLFINRNNVNLVELLTGASYLFRWSAYSLIFIPLQKLFSDEIINKLIYLIIISFVSIGILQYIFVPDIRPLEILQWDPHLHRMVGSLIDPGFTAIVLVFSIIFTKLDNTIKNNYKIILWILLFISLMLTYSRAGYLALIISNIFISLKIKSLKYLLIVISLFVTSIYILPRPGGEGVNLKRSSSIEARLINYMQSIQIFSLSPTIGSGFNLYRYTQRDTGIGLVNWQNSHAAAGADSSILFVLATTGIVGFFIYFQYLISLLKINSLLVKSSIVALLVHSIFLNSLFYPAVLLFISLLIAHFNLFTNGVSRPVSSHKN